MIEFRIADHTTRPGVKLVEVWDSGIFIATIVPGDGTSLRVISKYLEGATMTAQGLAVLMFK